MATTKSKEILYLTSFQAIHTNSPIREILSNPRRWSVGVSVLSGATVHSPHEVNLVLGKSKSNKRCDLVE